MGNGFSSKNKSKEELIYAIVTVVVVAIILVILLVPGKNKENDELIIKNNITEETEKNSFAGTVLEETTEYMIVEPLNDKPDVAMGDRVKVLYEEEHLDFYYGVGRKIVVYFDGSPTIDDDGIKTVKTDDISTEGFREFELEVNKSFKKEKTRILSSEDMQNITSYGYLRDSNLYYYGLDEVEITIKGFTMPLVTAIEQGRITLHGILEKANQEVADGMIEDLSYDDGGSQLYKYPDYNIIRYHTLDGNIDIYIGSTDMDINVADK